MISLAINQNMVSLPPWMVNSPQFKQEGVSLADLITLRGKYWYASCSYMKQHLRDSLKTPDKQIAIERLQELFLMVREGRYKFYKLKFDDMVRDYAPKTNQKNKLRNIENHLVPEFQGKRLHEIDIQVWAERIAETYTGSTAKSIISPAVEMGFEVNYKNISFKKGRKFNGSQILTEEVAVHTLEVLKSSPRTKIYSGIFHVALYSTMPLSDLQHLTKAQVVFSGPDAGITYTRRKTRHLDKPPLFIPMTNKLREAFRPLPIPIFPDDRWFPPMVTSTVSSVVGRALIKAGWKHGGAMHVLRHFGACFLIKQKVPLTTIRELMGHSDFKTTLIYARTDRETLKEGVKKFDVGK